MKHIFLTFVSAIFIHMAQAQVKRTKTASDNSIQAFTLDQFANNTFVPSSSYTKKPSGSVLSASNDVNEEFKWEHQELPLHSTSRNPGTSFTSLYDSSPPEELIEKYNLRPSVGGLASSASISDDFLYGKANISIPLTEFEYYDYKIPVYINNRYPQQVKSTFDEPTFYLNSRVGGDWTLSIDQFKVSRQVKGNPDEHPSKGYFTSNSQSKINNPENLSDSDIHNGLKGDWDPEIDVYSFSTPTGSGTFLININDGSYEVLSEMKFHVEFEIQNHKLHEFTITDTSGTQYVFGGDDSTIEVVQSKTAMYNLGSYNHTSSGKSHVKVLMEVAPNGQIMSKSILPDYCNLYANLGGPGIPNNPMSTTDVWNLIVANNLTIPSGYYSYLTHLYTGANGHNYYALVDNQTASYSAVFGASVDDAELRREEVNVGWYLKQIILTNEKTINFNYSNDWGFYPTYSSNQLRTHITRTNSDYYFSYIGTQGEVHLDNLSMYRCYPWQHQDLKFPISESHSLNFNFHKKPQLLSIIDEDYFQALTLSYATATDGYERQAPYMDNPNIVSDFTPVSGSTPFLLDRIRHEFNNCAPVEQCRKEIKFNNISEIALHGEAGVYKRVPEEDVSFLNSLVIDNQEIYTFNYAGARLSRIVYPTGAQKQFSAKTINFTDRNFNFWIFGQGLNANRHVAVNRYSHVKSIVTTTEHNVTTESFEFTGPRLVEGSYGTHKWLKHDLTSCPNKVSLESTAPIHATHASKGGVVFGEGKKWVNDELQISSTHQTIDNGDHTVSVFKLTNGNEPNYQNFSLSIPKSYVDTKIGLPLEQKSFNSNEEVLVNTKMNRTYGDTNFAPYKSLYLAKLEAGSWEYVDGIRKRGYAVYYHGADNDPLTVTTVNEQHFDNSSIPVTSTSTSHFKNVAIPSMGVNNRYASQVSTVDSQGETHVVKFRTPIEIENLTSTSTVVQNDGYEQLLQNNQVPVIESVAVKQGQLVSASIQEFKASPTNANGHSVMVPHVTKQLESDNVLTENAYNNASLFGNTGILNLDPKLKDQVVFDRYDKTGRLLEFHTTDGIYTSILWGYRNQYPVAVVKNARYSEIQSYSLQIQGSSYTFDTQALLNILNAMRSNLSQAQITGYIRTGKNIAIVVDPKGQAEYYDYDDSERLKHVKDRDKNIVTAYRYHYQNVVDNPIFGGISVSVNEANSTATFTVTSLTGGSGTYNYAWELVAGGSSSGPTTNSSYTVDFDCLTGLNNIEVNVTVQDANEAANSIVLNRNFYDLPCYTLVSADGIDFTEIRSQSGANTVFEGIRLDVLNLYGGSGNLKFEWEYRTSQNSNYNNLITVFSNMYYVPTGLNIMTDLCQNQIKLKCTITDQITGQVLILEQPGFSLLDCNDNPQ